MPDENKNQPPDSDNKGVPFQEGYQPKKDQKGYKGYQPGASNLNSDKPPQGGSGVPPKGSPDKGGEKKE